MTLLLIIRTNIAGYKISVLNNYFSSLRATRKKKRNLNNHSEKMISKVAPILSILTVAALGKPLNKDNQFDVVCHDSQDGFPVFVPHPYDCSLYFQCVAMTPVLMSCPSGLLFDSRIDVCNWPEYVDCEEATRK